MNQMIAPYGGTLVNLIDPAKGDALKQEAFSLPSLDLGWQQQCELEMLMSGAYSPLAGFMTRAQCERVEAEQQLDDGTFWPLPVTLTSQQKLAGELKPGDRVALRDGEGFMLAVLTVSDAWDEGAPGIWAARLRAWHCRRTLIFLACALPRANCGRCLPGVAGAV
jgi:sulfate adenylyltransferase